MTRSYTHAQSMQSRVNGGKINVELFRTAAVCTKRVNRIFIDVISRIDRHAGVVKRYIDFCPGCTETISVKVLTLIRQVNSRKAWDSTLESSVLTKPCLKRIIVICTIVIVVVIEIE